GCGRSPRGGTPAVARRGCRWGCAPRRGAAGGRPCAARSLRGLRGRGGGGRGLRRRRERVLDHLPRLVVEGGGDEPRLEGARRRVHAAGEQRVEEGGELPRGRGLGPRVVVHLVLG